MTTHAITSFDDHHMIYDNQTYARTTTTTYSTTINQPFHPYLSVLPIPTINICQNFLYNGKLVDDVGSATSSSYINSSDHYDNAFINNYDNPVEYLDNYNVRQSLINLSHDNDNLYDRAKQEEDKNDDNEKHCTSSNSRSTSPVLLYLENKNLALCACLISLLLLVIVGLGIFLLNKFIRPVVINTTVNNHYDMMNISNITTTTTSMITSQSTTVSPLVMLVRSSSTEISTTTIPIDNLSFSYPSCPFDRWGIKCENVCKPCGLGVCHPATGKCICPVDLYGEFCDLWKVDDKPKRGDMTS